MQNLHEKKQKLHQLILFWHIYRMLPYYVLKMQWSRLSLSVIRKDLVTGGLMTFDGISKWCNKALGNVEMSTEERI